jgi:outer membrane lipoprotein-sorting protein
MSLRVILSAVLLLAMPAAQAEPILREWIERQADIRSLRADFEQTRRLPALRIPLKKSGSVWLDSRSQFRWQVGDPPELLAIRSADGLLLIEPKKKRARILKDDAEGGPLRFDAISLPFAKSYEDFTKRFQVLSLIERGDVVEVTMSAKDPQIAAGMKSLRIVFRRSSGVVESLELNLRDGSQIFTTMTHVEVNPRIPANLFDFDLEGFQIDDRSAAP